jgi:hypothetical protein
MSEKSTVYSGKYLNIRKRKQQEAGENCVTSMWRLIICTPEQILLG